MELQTLTYSSHHFYVLLLAVNIKVIWMLDDKVWEWNTSTDQRMETINLSHHSLIISGNVLMHQARPASMGVVSSEMSLPYRQSPASSLKMSLAPSPASRTPSSANSLSVSSTTRSVDTEICTHRREMNDTLTSPVQMSYSAQTLDFGHLQKLSH